jgi:hypothetical protein
MLFAASRRTNEGYKYQNPISKRRAKPLAKRPAAEDPQIFAITT